ncbi:MAG: alpha/beta hydrolase [Pseudomonadota bacterium]
MAYLARDARRVYFEDHRPPGSGSTAVVLVHGWGMGVRCWDHVVPALVDAGQRVVLFDHRGCGRSDKDFADMGIGAIAGDLVALVETLELDGVLLNGWSLGGAVVVEAAARLGARVRALVLTGGATPAYVQKPDFPHGGSRDDMAQTLAALAADRVNFLHGLSKVVCAREVGVQIEDWLYRIFLEASPLAGATLGELADLDQREQLLALDLPLLSFIGSADGFVAPDIGRWVGEHHPRAQIVEYEGVGHAPFIEEREAYLERLVEFTEAHL